MLFLQMYSVLKLNTLFVIELLPRKQIMTYVLLLLLVSPLVASSPEIKECYEGFSGITKALMSIPYALANVFATLAAVIYMLLTAVTGVLCVAFGVAVGLFEFILNQDHKFSLQLFSKVGYFFSICLDWYKAVTILNDWYMGNCL